MEKFCILTGCARSIKLLILIGLIISLNSLNTKAQNGNGMYDAIDAGVIGSCGGYGYFSDYRDTYYNANTFGNYNNDIWYKFTITSPTQVDMSHCGNGIGTNMALLDEWGSQINTSYGYGPLCSSIDASLSEYLSPGTYYLVCEGSYYNGYIFTEISTSGVALPTGHSFYDPIIVGQVMGLGFTDYQNNADCFGDEIGQPSNDIYYQFTLSDPSTVKLSHCGSSFDTYMHLLDASGNIIASNDDSGPMCISLQASMRVELPAGTYYLVSEGYGLNSGYITTSISLEVPGAYFSNAIDAGILTANVSYSDTKNNNPINGFGNEIGGSNDDIFYKFTINEPTNTQVAIMTCGNGFGTNASLLDAFGNLIAFGVNFSPSCSSGNTIIANLGSGTYYIVSESNPFYSGSITTQITIGQPLGWTDVNQNYVRTHIPRSNFTDYSSLNAAANNKDLVQTSTQYIDGLGMAIQTVQRQASPAGYDLVQPIVYDAQGREYRKYLPYRAVSTDGGFKIGSPDANVKAFYSPAVPGAANIAVTEYPFADAVIEKSPLGRILEQGAPGETWQPVAGSHAGHTVKTVSTGNLNGEAKLWSISGLTCSAIDYYAGTLLKTTTTDENGSRIIEYRDRLGKIVLKQSEKEGGTFISTHYVYDDLDNLRYVIPPAVTVNSFTEADALFDQYIYAYRYDDQNRLVEKKLPGKGWEYMVYNQLDQIVLTQDAVQRQSSKWLYTRYDALNRAVMTGEYTNSSNRPMLQAAVLAHTGGAYETFTGAGTEGYSLNTFPQADYNVLTVSYFGTYSIPGKTSSYDATASGITAATKGLLTGSKVNILGSSNYLLTVNYYDEYARLREAIAQNHLGGTDRIVNSYNFNGELTSSTRSHTSSTASLTVANRYIYDHVGRQKQSFQRMNSDAEVKLAESSFNEVGQLMVKTLHNDVQSTSYTYNPRGWLKRSSSDQFDMQLKYEDGTTPQYNGNISNQLYTNGTANTFTYSYDKLNRLLQASAGNNLGETIAYDVMGNITSLSRDGFSTNSYSYANTGNRLGSISGFTNSSYGYDVNGNLKSDTQKGITDIGYNHLNLPNTVTGPVNLAYTYDATGSKLRKVGASGTIDYVGGIQYTNGVIDFIQTEEGIAHNNGGTYTYRYNLTDHLGNVRTSFDIYSGAVRILQRDDYYAFGLRKSRPISGSSGAVSLDNKHLYNGKELQDELGQYDYGARFYDPVIGRWNVVDRFAEKYLDMSQYQYAANNPIANIDVNGDSTWTTTKTQINGSDVTFYRTTHITGKVLKTSTSYGSSGDFAQALNAILNSQTGTSSYVNENGGKTTFVYNIEARYEGASSMNDVKKSDHLVVLVGNVLGQADPTLGGGEAAGLALTPGKIAYVESGASNALNNAFHEVGHNLGLNHPKPNGMDNTSSNPMSYKSKATNFSSLQMALIYNNVSNGSTNKGSNSARILNVNEGYNNVSSNERPYQGKRIQGMRIPLPIKNN